MAERRRRTNLGRQQQYLYVHATYGAWRQANRAYTLTGTIRRCGCSQQGPNMAVLSPSGAPVGGFSGRRRDRAGPTPVSRR